MSEEKKLNQVQSRIQQYGLASTQTPNKKDLDPLPVKNQQDPQTSPKQYTDMYSRSGISTKVNYACFNEFTNNTESKVKKNLQEMDQAKSADLIEEEAETKQERIMEKYFGISPVKKKNIQQLKEDFNSSRNASQTKFNTFSQNRQQSTNFSSMYQPSSMHATNTSKFVHPIMKNQHKFNKMMHKDESQRIFKSNLQREDDPAYLRMIPTQSNCNPYLNPNYALTTKNARFINFQERMKHKSKDKLIMVPSCSLRTGVCSYHERQLIKQKRNDSLENLAHNRDLHQKQQQSTLNHNMSSILRANSDEETVSNSSPRREVSDQIGQGNHNTSKTEATLHANETQEDSLIAKRSKKNISSTFNLKKATTKSKINTASNQNSYARIPQATQEISLEAPKIVMNLSLPGIGSQSTKNAMLDDGRSSNFLPNRDYQIYQENQKLQRLQEIQTMLNKKSQVIDFEKQTNRDPITKGQNLNQERFTSFRDISTLNSKFKSNQVHLFPKANRNYKYLETSSLQKDNAIHMIYDTKVDITKEMLSKGVVDFGKHVDRQKAADILVDKSPRREAYDHEVLMRAQSKLSNHKKSNSLVPFQKISSRDSFHTQQLQIKDIEKGIESGTNSRSLNHSNQGVYLPNSSPQASTRKIFEKYLPNSIINQTTRKTDRAPKGELSLFKMKNQIQMKNSLAMYNGSGTPQNQAIDELEQQALYAIKDLKIKLDNNKDLAGTTILQRRVEAALNADSLKLNFL